MTEALAEALRGLRRIVEEIDGAMEHGAWRDKWGLRFKDTPEWVAAYNALAAYDAEREAALQELADLGQAWDAAPPAGFEAGWIAGRDAAKSECIRVGQSYARSLALYPEDDPERRLVKYGQAAAVVIAENIAALAPAASPAPDLSDPNVVHLNMLRGTIAKPTLEQIIHIYGIDALCKALAPHIVRGAEAAPWTLPPEADRPDGYRCLGWVAGQYVFVNWSKGRSAWRGDFGDYVDPMRFRPPPRSLDDLAPLPSAQKGEAT